MKILSLYTHIGDISGSFYEATRIILCAQRKKKDFIQQALETLMSRGCHILMMSLLPFWALNVVVILSYGFGMT